MNVVRMSWPMSFPCQDTTSFVSLIYGTKSTKCPLPNSVTGARTDRRGREVELGFVRADDFL